MNWMVHLIVAVVLLALSAVFAVIKGKSAYKRGSIIDPLKILFAGVIASAVVLFLPIYDYFLMKTECGALETALASIHNMIRLFIVDGEFSFILDNVNAAEAWVARGYYAVFAVLFVLAPVLTFGFVLSFFKNVSAYKRYITHFYSDTYVFSELNDKSVTLAESLVKSDKKRLLVFTDVFERDEEKSFELTERAREIGAICFKKDIVTVNFSIHSKRSKLNFFVLGENEAENISQALKLVDKFKERENTELYVFSTKPEAEVLLSNAFNNDDELEAKIHLRRVSEVNSLINRTLYERGYEDIFESAYMAEDGLKHINAVVVGMGKHGSEMVRSLAWFCQMDGYRVEINAFDIDPLKEERFVSQCPELMDERFNGNFTVEGEAKYKITVHSGMNIDTAAFDKAVTALPRSTYVFVALGDDDKNISTAIKLRSLFKRNGYEPVIQAIVYDTDKKDALSDIRNFKKEEYNIHFIGDMRYSYSEAVILHSDVERAALERHLKWGAEKDFWQYDYNYKSSIASAIHYVMKKRCGMAGIEKAPADRDENERRALRVLEHCRWNAYMRSEGYVYGGTVERSGRCDLAKMHNCLVPFDQLPLKEQEKDDD